MRIIVFGGGGKMGRAIAWDLVQDEAVERVGLADVSLDKLEAAGAWLNSEKLSLHHLDLLDKNRTAQVMEDYDVGVISAPNRKLSYLLVETAITASLDVVDILEEYHRHPDSDEREGLVIPKGLSLDEYGEELHRQAVDHDVLILDGMGFAPGLSNITLGHGIRKMHVPRSAIARVGGIPSKETAQKYPLKYVTTWAFEHVLREYCIQTEVIKNGEVVKVDSLSDQEAFVFDRFGIRERLECATTPGMPSFVHTGPDLEEFSEKTIRWPGHYQTIRDFKKCGLLQLSPVNYRGQTIVPREFLSTLLEKRLKPTGDAQDVCVMYNTVTGLIDGREAKIEYFMWEETNEEHGISAMGRVTGFPAAIGAKLIGTGMIQGAGIVPPETAIYGKVYDDFLLELESRQIHIEEVVTTTP